jgi:beta-lactamase class A
MLRRALVEKSVSALALLLSPTGAAGSLDRAALQVELNSLVTGLDGRVGVCAQDSWGRASLRGNERFPLQSVIKLFVAIAVLDAVEQRGWHLEDPILVRRPDLSLYVQPIEKMVGENGYSTTVGDLVRRAIVDSDSAATDILIRKLGGPIEVQAVLERKSLRGVRIDRDERHLQTEIVGLQWRPEYVDDGVLHRAIEAVPKSVRAAAHRRYQSDPRDTATPCGMAALLQSLAEGKLLSPRSTAYILNVMKETATFPDRLKAGVSSGWTLAHKTGTGGFWNGVTAATNDVGVLTSPDHRAISVVVFIADSRAQPDKRAAFMAKVAAATIRHYK